MISSDSKQASKGHPIVLASFIFVLLGLSAGAQSTDTSSILVNGEVTHILVLKATDLATMNRITYSTGEGDGPEQTFSGVSLADILDRAGAPLGKQLRKENMTKYLLVKAGDGYQVLFTLPELDSSFTDRTIFLADHLNGKTMPAGKGPFRIIVPGEKKHGRWIWDVRSLTIGTAK